MSLFLHKNLYTLLILGAVDVAQWLGELPALEEDRSLIVSIHIRMLKPDCNSISRRCNTLFWPPQAPTHMWNTDT